MIYRLILLFFFLSIKSLAQNPYAIFIGEQQGLPSNTVYNILHDNAGYTWVATEEGLSKYDGFSFKTYTSQKQTSIPGSNINEDVIGRIWYQNFDGYCYYTENDTLKPLQQSFPINYNPIGITDNYLFLIQTKGIDVYSISTLKKIKTISAPFTFKNIQHSEFINNTFYFIENFTLYKIDDRLIIEKVCTLPFNQKSNLLLITELLNKPVVFEKKSNEKLLTYSNLEGKLQTLRLPDDMLIHGTANIDGYFCIYGNKGILLYKNKQLIYHWFKDNSITHLSKDYLGNYWIGTLNNGIYVIPDIDNVSFSIADEPTRIISNSQGHYVFNKFGACNLFSFNFENKKPIYQLHNTPIYYAFLDESKNIFYTSSLGMNIFNLNTHTQKTYYQYALKEVAKVNDSYMAFAISGLALLYKNGNTKTTWDSIFNTLDQGIEPSLKVLLKNSRVKTIAYNQTNDAIYIGTNIGLHKITPLHKNEILLDENKIYAKQIVTINNCIYILNTKNKLYLTTNDKNFSLLNNNLAIENIKGIRKINDNLLCVYGENKLMVLNGLHPDSVFYETQLNINSSTIKDLSFYNNTLYVLADNTIIKLQLNNKQQNKMESLFYIDNTTVNGKSINLNNSILKHTENNISIRYAILNYAKSNEDKLYYSLNQTNWEMLPNNSRTLQFAALESGVYTVYFKLNNTVLQSSTLHFEIKTAWWKRWWFILTCLLIISTMVYSYYKWQYSILQKRNILLNQNIKLEKELNKSVLTAIKSQMNPHFFYNALNTIQAYIFTNDRTNAANYLNKFSKLTRSILEMSDKELVTLKDELDALELYLSLEKMRVEDELNYTINTDAELDIETIKIPPMLIQPHIENAIKHGLLHKEGEKTLAVSIQSSAENKLTITVDDNGIGRKRAQELNALKKQKHESFSTEANQTRLELMNKLRNTGASLTITDKYDKQNRPTGTLVTITIPY